MSLGSWNAPAHEHAGPRGVQRPELVGRGETPAVQHHAQPLGLLLQAGAGLQAEREHDHVELFLDLLHLGAGVDQAEVPRAGHFVVAGNEGTDVAHAQLVLRPIAVAVEILAEGPQVEEEDGDVQARLVLLGQDGFLGGGHAADRRAVVVVAAVVARADALDEGQPPAAALPSAGRRMWPCVGPEAESIRSNCTLVSTLGASP